MTLVGTLKNIAYIALFIILFPIIPLMVRSVQQLYNRYIDPRSQVGVLPIRGILYDSHYFTKQLNTFFKDDAIKAILLRIECPGSAAGTGQVIYNELIELKKIYPKPVIVLVENVCASGGYYIASAADHIIASPMALLGSIGVAMPYFFQLKEFAEYHKIKFVPLAAGEYKNSTNPFTEITPAQKKMLQSVIDSSYEQFAADIAEHRHIPLATKNEWANGKIFNGRQALDFKLIDELGSISQAKKVIKEKANISGDIKWICAPSRSSIWALIGGESDDEQTLVSSLANECLTIVQNRYNNHIIQ
jgi:protease-4